MKKILLVIFTLLLLCSCDTGNENNKLPEPPENKPPFGWRKAGLEPEEGNGFGVEIDIFHFGEYIFVKSHRWSDKYDDYKDNNSQFIFYSKQGSMAWDILEIPEKATPSAIYADTGGLYVGTREIGQLWHYNPYSEIWTDLKVPKLKESLNIYGIARLDGKLVLSMGDCEFWSHAYTNTFAPVLIQDGDGWENITPPEELIPKSKPLVFIKAKEWLGNLFIATGRNNEGFWKFNSRSREWASIPTPIINWITASWKCNSPYALEVFDNKLYVGFGNYCGVFILNEDLSSFTGVDSLRKNLYIQKSKESKWELAELSEHPNPEIYHDYAQCDESNVPDVVRSFATNGRDLFLVGVKGVVLGQQMNRNGKPLLYTGNRGEPKGWRRIHYKGGWEIGGGQDGIFPVSLGTETVGLDVIGDTLYAAERKGGIYKFPLSDLDSGIVNENPYPYYCVERYFDDLPDGYIPRENR